MYTFSQYQRDAARTADSRANFYDRLMTDVFGLIGEVGEIASEVQHAREQRREIDVENIVEECGDCLWRIADILSALGFSLEDAAIANIQKLLVRHPGGFSPETSIQRLDKQATGE